MVADTLLRLNTLETLRAQMVIYFWLQVKWQFGGFECVLLLNYAVEMFADSS